MSYQSLCRFKAATTDLPQKLTVHTSASSMGPNQQNGGFYPAFAQSVFGQRSSYVAGESIIASMDVPIHRAGTREATPPLPI